MNKRTNVILVIAGVVVLLGLAIFSGYRSFNPPQKAILDDPTLPRYSRRPAAAPGNASNAPDSSHTPKTPLSP